MRPGESDTSNSLPLDSRGRMTVRSIFVLLLLGAALWVAWDFLPALAWAVVIVGAAWPAYERFRDRISPGRPSSLAACLFTLLVAVVVFAPILLALNQISEFREPAGKWLAEAKDNGIPVPPWLAQVPLAGDYASRLWNAQLGDPKAVAGLLAGFGSEAGSGWMQAFGGNLLHRLFLFAMSLIATFFLFRDGDWVARRALDTAARLLGAPGERLGEKMITAVRGTVNGTIVVAVAEGALITVGYLLAGVPKPFVFGLLTTAFAMLPFGAWIAFTAAALVLGAGGGSQIAATAVFIWGAAVMLAGDHFLWPSLVGSAARLPFVFALVGIFGGLQAFGLVGLFLGPVVMAAVLTVWREWLGVEPRTPVARQDSSP